MDSICSGVMFIFLVVVSGGGDLGLGELNRLCSSSAHLKFGVKTCAKSVSHALSIIRVCDPY